MKYEVDMVELHDLVNTAVKQKYGGNLYACRTGEIRQSTHKYPYPRTVGYWHVDGGKVMIMIKDSELSEAQTN